MATKRKYPEQLKIAGTGRIDRDPEIEELAEAAREAADLASAHKAEETSAAQALLDAMLRKNKPTYTYEAPDGRLRRVSVRQLNHKVVIADVKSYDEVPSAKGEESQN